MDTIFLYGTLGIFTIITFLCFLKAESVKKQNGNLAFLLWCLGMNTMLLPVALFIGGMGTDAPDSGFSGFLFGFFFVQTIPLLFLSIGVVRIFMVKRQPKTK